MMGPEYTLAQVFMRSMASNGPALTIGLAAAFVGLYLAAKYGAARIEISKQAEDSRAGERVSMIAELTAAREQNHRVISNHLAHAEAESVNLRQALDLITQAQQKQVVVLNNIAENLTAHRDSMARRLDVSAAKMDAIHLDLRGANGG